MLPSEEENPFGFHQRYIIRKVDGTSVDPDAVYLVLRLDSGGSDPAHAAACRKAALCYANAIEQHLPQVAKDLRARCRES